jgi:hypothetical protein
VSYSGTRVFVRATAVGGFATLACATFTVACCCGEEKVLGSLATLAHFLDFVGIRASAEAWTRTSSVFGHYTLSDAVGG